MHHRLFTHRLFLIGIFLLGMSAQAQDSDLLQPNSSKAEATSVEEDVQIEQEVEESTAAKEATDKLEEEPTVLVEPSFLLRESQKGGVVLVPYQYRRQKWGSTVGVAYSLFNPADYEPDQIVGLYEDVYGTPETPLIELQVNIKRNFDFGSLGVDFGVGFFRNASQSDLIESDLSLTILRLGLKFSLDNLYEEPWVVPYFGGGAYTVKFKEAQDTVSFNGNTQAALYASGGILVQLDWFDWDAAREAFQEGGIENTFLLLEARKFFISSAPEDPDFESAIHGNFGLAVEF